MKFEILKKDNLKRNIIIGVFIVLIISAVVLNFTRAKHRSTASVPIVDSEINYIRPDLDVVAFYLNGEQANELDSSKKYTLDPNNSTCTYKDGTTIENLRLSYDSETGSLSISPFTTRGTKCTLYFEEVELIKDTLLSYYPTVLTRTDFSTTVTTTTTGTIYKSADSTQYDEDGEVYYFAGNPTDNWVYFAGFYWRIIRINGDGSIRLIYQGTSANTSGSNTQIGTSAFNSSYDNNMYVGFMYTQNQVHGTGTSSTIKEELDGWYDDNLFEKDNDYIDTNAGFCGDRTSTTTNGGTPNDTGGTSVITTYYGTSYRLSSNKPSFKCPDEDNDLYTISSSNKGNNALNFPIGLITADEAAFAGGVLGTSNVNQSYYLYTGQTYWAISPYDFFNTNGSGGGARMFQIHSNGYLVIDRVHYSNGIRPVINLKATTTISGGDGTAQNPFIVD